MVQLTPSRRPSSRSRVLASLTLAAGLLAWARPADAQFDSLTMSAASSLYAIPNAGSYDAANVYLAPDGSIWSASALENVILKLSPDGLQSTRWTLPATAAPSYLLPNDDGTFWVVELGNPNIALFDPATGNLTEWPDASRRLTSLIRRPDGKFWTTETGGPLVVFDPASNSFDYHQSAAIYSLSYPFLDDDGSIWACDFVGSYIIHFTADASTARRWLLPDAVSYPSKIIRGRDGALWISVFGSGQIARFDPATSELRTYDLTLGSYPYDMVLYKDRILYSDQGYGIVGFFDPRGATPSLVQVLTPVDPDLTMDPVVTKAVEPGTTTLVPVTDDVPVPPPAISTGNRSAGNAEYLVGVSSVWALAVDEKKNRIVFGTKGYIGTLFPPIPGSADDLYFPSAASIGGAAARWKTQLVTWNRGTPDSTGTKNPISMAEQLIPNGWIAGYLPNSTQSLGVNLLLAQDDPIGNEMEGPDSFGALRLEASVGNAADLFGWARVYRERDDGGTYGFAMNPFKPAAAVQAGDSATIFTPPDTAQTTNAGFVTVDAASGTVSIVDASGATLASRSFSWPGGTHTQYSPLFSSFGLAPVPSARFVVSVTTGTALPFGTSSDPVTRDPIGLEFQKASEAVTLQWIPAVFRAAGPLGETVRTDVQLFNPGTTAASVQLVFRSAAPPGGPLPSATVAVAPGAVVNVPDVLGARMGLSSATGILDVISDQPVSVFARVHASDPSGGGYGYGLGGKLSTAAVPGGSRGVLLSVTDSGWNVIQSDLLLANISDVATTVTLNLTAFDGNSTGTRDYALAPKEVRYVTTPWFSIAGYGTAFGRIDVVPSGTASVFSTLIRQDRKTGDTDAILPVVTSK